jgi:hypothetical protein
MTYANTLCAAGDVVGAHNFANEALAGYRRSFAERNPLRLAAAVNYAAIQRALGDRPNAYSLDESTVNTLVQVLGPEHPYVLAAETGFAIDHALRHQYGEARDLSAKVYVKSVRVRGGNHPDTLMCAVNAARDAEAYGDEAPGLELGRTIEKLADALGTEHPVVHDAKRGERLECTIEPPPT